MNPTYDFNGQVALQVPPSDAADESIDNFERVTAVNQRGVWACMKHELRVMRAQGSGAIVNCSAEEVAAAVLWLCSPGASFVIGVGLPVDGGFTAH